MKQFLIFIFFSSLILSAPSTKDDIKMLINYMDKRFDDVNRRFDDVNKRFEEARDQTNKRFEEARDQTNKRFDFMENIMIAMLGFMGMVAGFVMWDRYTMMKQTKKEIKQEMEMEIKRLKEEVTLETISKLEQKVDKTILEKIALILEKVVENNKEAREIFSKHRLVFSWWTVFLFISIGNFSIGKVNYIAKSLADKGFIKIGNFINKKDKTKYKYILTNDGIKEKISITRLFIERKKLEYERLQEELEYDMQKIGNIIND